ncbi:MAG: NAD(P)/FAD-dependent oxidoreductase, partial [Blastocatellia bacterium]|nr:NAD(P)/FAD-dependent oxidoreductase [Blastocatellia bacterium]
MNSAGLQGSRGAGEQGCSHASGMMNRAHHTCDVAVIGGGPAGLAAAYSASQRVVPLRSGRVMIIDDNPEPLPGVPGPGGQIWRGEKLRPTTPEATFWFEKVENAGVEFVCGARVINQPETGMLTAETLEGVCEIAYRKLILATGARERFLPFPGWTLPGVAGAGGLQALVKSGLPIKGKRVVVAGSGPLLMAVAAYLRKQGAEVILIAEQTGWGRLFRFGLGILTQPGKAIQAIELKRKL